MFRTAAANAAIPFPLFEFKSTYFPRKLSSQL
jgi:hypothetical protein